MEKRKSQAILEKHHLEGVVFSKSNDYELKILKKEITYTKKSNYSKNTYHFNLETEVLKHNGKEATLKEVDKFLKLYTDIVKDIESGKAIEKGIKKGR